MGSAPGEATVSDIGRQVNDAISNWRLLMLDKGTEEYTKVATNFSGFEAIMEMMHKRLAAAADIPMTRFFGQSPAGMNATGESDMQNYAAMIEAKRGAMLKDPMMMLDQGYWPVMLGLQSRRSSRGGASWTCRIRTWPRMPR